MIPVNRSRRRRSRSRQYEPRAVGVGVVLIAAGLCGLLSSGFIYMKRGPDALHDRGLWIVALALAIAGWRLIVPSVRTR